MQYEHRLLMRASLLAGYFLLSALQQALAQSLPYGECRAGYWNSNRNLDDEPGVANTTCLINWRKSLSASVDVGLNGRLGWQDAGAADRGENQLREGYLETYSGPWSLRAGRQIIAWGRADRINPTDSLSPKDFTVLVPEDEEQRIGINAILGRYELEKGPSLIMVVAPRFEAHKIPEGSLPTNLVRESEPDSLEWAVKLDRIGEGFDWSVSYFDGFNRFARYWTQPTDSGSFVFRTTYEQARTFGTDFATNAGRWAVRGEASASDLRPLCDSCNLTELRIYRLVLGVDRDFAETANVNFQFFAARRTKYIDPQSLSLAQQRTLAESLDRLNSEYSERDYGIVFRLLDTYLNNRLKLELGVIIDLEGNSRLIRPRVSYAYSDSIKLIGGIDQFYGPEQSFFGSREKNQAAFVEIAMVF